MKKPSPLMLAKLKTMSLRFGISILVIWAFGFLALPPLVKHFATKAASDALHRTVLIEELRINPITLSVRIKGLSMSELGSTSPFFTVNELYANLEMSSIFRGVSVLKAIKVKAPYIKIVRRDDATYNVDDILAELLKPSDPPAQYSINNIELVDGKIEFEDRPAHAKHSVTDIQLAIPFLSNLPYQTEIFVKPNFSANINGSLINLKGQLKPFGKNHESNIMLALDHLDLARYFAYIQLPQKLNVPSAILDSNLTISFIQPPSQPPLITLSGNISLKDAVINDSKNNTLARFSLLAVQLQSANLTRKQIQLKSLSLQKSEFHAATNNAHSVVASADEIKLTGGTLNFSKELALLQPGVEMTGFKLQQDDKKDAMVTVAALSIKNIALDLGKHNITLEEFISSGGHTQLKRNNTGAIDLIRLFASAPDQAAANKNTPPFQFNVQKLALTDYNVHFSDAISGSPLDLNADAINLHAENISSQKDTLSNVTITLNLNKTGTVSAAGKLGINPLATQLALDINSIKLKPFQPYFTDLLNIIITDGTSSAKGDLIINTGNDGTPRVTFNGDASIDRLATIDKLNEDDFLKWGHLRFNKLGLATQPLSINIAEIGLSDFYSRLIIHADGTLNLQQIIKDQSNATPATTGQATPPLATPEKIATTPADRPKITIAKLTLANGKVDFTDNFIKPNYDANITGLGGSVKGLSSTVSTLAEVALKSRVDNQGRLDISGKINPLSGNLFLDLMANLNDYELSSLTPYSSKYAGYNIQKGKLSFDVKYKIENSKLSAENHLFLNQLTFGDKVDSKDATNLPVMLAVALLKDRNGNIDINLPIAGSLDDPQFSMGGIIIKVIVNLLSKAITSPFALLGSLFAGGEELAFLEFDYGKYAITSNGESKLNNLAKALHDRPALKLDIAGQVDPEMDLDGLRQTMLERKVKIQKFNELHSKGSDITSVDAVIVETSEYVKYLTKAYKQEKIPNKPRNIVGLAKDLPVAEMEKLMRTNFQVTDNDMRELISNRAMEAKEYLINVGKIEPDRVFLVTPNALKSDQEKPAYKGKLSRVNFSLGAR